MLAYCHDLLRHVCWVKARPENFSFQLLHSHDGNYRAGFCAYSIQRRCSSCGPCSDKRCLYRIRSWWDFLSVSAHKTFIWFSLFQMICPTAQKASPPRFSASTSPPWKGTRPTSSEQSFGLWGCQTQAPRGMNSVLSSTRCVKVPFPCPSTKIRGKAHSRGDM